MNNLHIRLMNDKEIQTWMHENGAEIDVMPPYKSGSNSCWIMRYDDDAKGKVVRFLDEPLSAGSISNLIDDIEDERIRDV